MQQKNTVHLIGNAHIDPVWLWRWQQGYAEIKATFRSALDRIEEYPDFIFTSACAAYYKWIEENDPPMFDVIRRRVSEGRWYFAGGMWIQPDCNIPSGESFARHFLYSQRYFEEKFGIRATVGYNVDSFGHNGSLPKLFKGAGIDSYVMMRPSEHEKPEIPENAFWWESNDGSRVLAYRIFNMYGFSAPESEVASFEDEPQVQRLRVTMRIADAAGQPAMHFYGVGNHGGGPTIKNIERIHKVQATTGDRDIVMSHPGRFFEDIRSYELPVWNYDLQRSACGCYSAMSEVKINNRRAENRLLTAEKFSVMSGALTDYAMPAGGMDKAWQNVLFNQFHDIICGCSIREAYEDARESHGHALSVAAEVSNAAVQRLSWAIDTMDEKRNRRSKESDRWFWELDGMGIPVVVFNPLSWRRNIPVVIGRPVKKLTDDDGNLCPTQRTRASRTNSAEKWDGLFVADVPAMGYRVYWAYLKGEGPPDESSLSAARYMMENKFLKLEFEPHKGYIKSLYDKENKKEVFIGRACVPLVIDIHDSDTWGHNIYEFRDVAGRFENAEVSLLEEGPVRCRIRVVSRYDRSVLTQDFMLYENSRSVEVAVRLDWREQFKMLKLSFPVNIENDRVTYDIPFGNIERLTGGMEDSGQMWFDVTGADGVTGADDVTGADGVTGADDVTGADGEYGLSILNVGKYAFDVLGSDMRMTIANSSLYADHFAGVNRDELCEFIDQGVQRFRYALLPHKKGWREAGTVKAAIELNTEETHLCETYHKGPLPRSYEGIRVSADNVVVTSVKPSYDGGGTVIRVYETAGVDTRAIIDLPLLDRKLEFFLPNNSIKTFYIPACHDAAVFECDLTERI